MSTTENSQINLGTVTVSSGTGTIASTAYFNPGTAGAINHLGTLGTYYAGDLYDLFINIGTAAVTVAAGGYLTVTTISQDPATGNYVQPGTTAAAPPVSVDSKSFAFNSGAVVTGEIKLKDIPAGSYSEILMLGNFSGTIWPNSTLTAVRRSTANW